MFKRPKALWISSSLEEGVALPGGKDDLVDGTDLLTSLVVAAGLPEVSAVITSLDDLLDVGKDGLLGLLLPVRVGVGSNDEILLEGEGLDNLGVLTAALHVLHVDGSESRDNLRLDVAVVLVLDHLDDLLDLIVGTLIRLHAGLEVGLEVIIVQTREHTGLEVGNSHIVGLSEFKSENSGGEHLLYVK